MRPTLIVIISSLLVSGCASFQSQKKINLAPFAENAVSVVSEIEYGLSQARAIHTRPFIDGPQVGSYKAEWERLGRILRGIVAYSIQVVTISQSDKPDSEKAAMLSDYLERVIRPFVENPGYDIRVTATELDEVLARIRSSEDYFSAMNSAQPIVDEVARVAESAIASVGDAQNKARLEVAGRIEREHAPVLSFRSMIKAGQSRTFKTIEYLGRYGLGERAALDSMLLLDPQLQEYLRPGEPLDSEKRDIVERRLVFRMQAFTQMQEQIFPELEQYQKEMKELDDLITVADRGLKQSRGAIIVWRRSHQTMAAGITEPAAIDLFGVAQSAVKKVVPLP